MSFFNPVNITNKPGSRSILLEIVKNHEVLVISSMKMLERINSDKALSGFIELPNVQFEHGFHSNPSLTDMAEIAKKYSSNKLDLIIGIGGGSAMDVAKIASVAIPAMSNGIHLSGLLVMLVFFLDLNP